MKRLVFLFGAATFALACGSRVETTTGASTTSNGSGTGGSGEAGSGGAAGGAGSGGSDTGPRYFGWVAARSADEPLLPRSTVVAYFFELEGPDCVELGSYGDCSVRKCLLYGDGDRSRMMDVGVITVTGDLRTATPAWNGNGYVPDEADEPLFTAGSTLLIESTGNADAPAFSETLLAPGQIALVEPVLTPPLIIDKSQDITFTWIGSTADLYSVLILGSIRGKPLEPTTVRCRFPVVNGTGTVPAEALAHLPTTSQGVLSSQVLQGKEIRNGDWGVTLMASAPATTDHTASGKALVYNVFIQ